MRNRLIGADGLTERDALAGIRGGEADRLARQPGERGRNQQLPFLDGLGKCLSARIVARQHGVFRIAKTQLGNRYRGKIRFALALAFRDAALVVQMASYGIESRFVREVARLFRFTAVPGTPAFVLGVTNLRGEILALFDLRQLLGVVAEGITDLGRIVVLGEHRREFGLLADAASEILYVPGASLAQTETAWGRAYVRGVSPDGVIVLSGEALLNDPRLTIDAGQDSRQAS